MSSRRGRGRDSSDGDDEKNKLKLITPPFRGSFVKLRKAEAYKGGDAKFSIAIVLDEKDEFWDDLEEKIDAACEKKWDVVPKKFKDPIREGSDTDYDDFEGKLFVRAASDSRPGILDEDGEPITDMEGVYSGRWYRAVVRTWAWDHPQSGKGVSLQLDNILLVNAPRGESDEAFGGGSDAAEDFADYIDGSSSKRDRDEDRGSSRRRRGSKSNPLD